jgi:hypothetical protein
MAKKQTTGTPARQAMAGGRRQPRPVRAYNTEFTPRGEGREFKLNRIPATFWDEVRSKAKREGVSLRGLVLTYLRDWKDGTRPAA